MLTSINDCFHSLPIQSEFHHPVNFLNQVIDFLAEEIISEEIELEMKKMSAIFPWINEDSAATYFELTLGKLSFCCFIFH
jgi:hypothetical protein